MPALTRCFSFFLSFFLSSFLSSFPPPSLLLPLFLQRNASRDWGESQLHSSSDWAVDTPFLKAGIYLWLNYHTIHHLFPKTDFAHHPAMQQILMRLCKKHNVEYVLRLIKGFIYIRFYELFTKGLKWRGVFKRVYRPVRGREEKRRGISQSREWRRGEEERRRGLVGCGNRP